jgi:hypothetical protein
MPTLVGCHDGPIFQRVRELQPVERLSPERGHRITLKAVWVSSILVDGRAAWPD